MGTKPSTIFLCLIFGMSSALIALIIGIALKLPMVFSCFVEEAVVLLFIFLCWKSITKILKEEMGVIKIALISAIGWIIMETIIYVLGAYSEGLIPQSITLGTLVAYRLTYPSIQRVSSSALLGWGLKQKNLILILAFIISICIHVIYNLVSGALL